MSDTTKNIIVAFKTTGDVSLKKSLKEANTELRLIDSETKKAISGVEGFGKKSKINAARIDEVNKKISVQSKKLSTLRAHYDDVVASQGKESIEAKKVRTSMNQTEASINGLKNKLTELKTTSKGTLSNISKESAGAEKGFSILKTGIMGAIGAFSGFVYGMKNTIDNFRELKADAQKASMSIENFQVFSKLFKKAGVDTDVLKTSMAKLTGQIRKVDEDGDNASATLATMGISVRNMNGDMRSSDNIYIETIRHLAEMKNETERNMVAQQLFGRSYAELSPILNQGAEGIKKNIEAIQGSGNILTQEQIDEMEKASIMMDKLQGVTGNMANKLTALIVPALLPYLNNLSTFLQNNKDNIVSFVEGIGNFITTIAPFVGYILIAVAAVKGFLIVAEIITAISTLITFLKELQIATTIMTGIQWALNAAMEANPIGLIILAIAALVTSLIWAYNNVDWFREGVNNTCQAIGNFFNGLGQSISNCWDWIVEKASRICQSIGYFFNGVGKSIGDAFNFAVNIGVNAFNWLVSCVSGIVGKIIGFFGGIGSTAAAILKGAVNGVIGFINNVISGINYAIGMINNIPGVSIGTIGQIGYMAKGGTLVSGMAIVGEAGPELLYNTSQGSKIIPLNKGDKKEGVAVGPGLPEKITINLMDMSIVTKLKEKINEKNDAEYILASFSL